MTWMNSEPAPPTTPPSSPPWRTRLAGILAGEIAISGTCGIWFLANALFSATPGSGLLSFPSMFVVPALGGLMASVDEAGLELGHFHGNGLLDVPVGNEVAASLLASGRVRPHRVFPRSKWVSFQIQSEADVPFALELLGFRRGKNERR